MGGQSRRFGDVRATSALPLIAGVRCEDGRSERCPRGGTYVKFTAAAADLFA